jgi:hypothetical protein
VSNLVLGFQEFFGHRWTPINTDWEGEFLQEAAERADVLKLFDHAERLPIKTV